MLDLNLLKCPSHGWICYKWLLSFYPALLFCWVWILFLRTTLSDCWIPFSRVVGAQVWFQEHSEHWHLPGGGSKQSPVHGLRGKRAPPSSCLPCLHRGPASGHRGVRRRFWLLSGLQCRSWGQVRCTDELRLLPQELIVSTDRILPRSAITLSCSRTVLAAKERCWPWQDYQ